MLCDDCHRDIDMREKGEIYCEECYVKLRDENEELKDVITELEEKEENINDLILGVINELSRSIK